jgi:nicotinamidase-related amidase
MIRTARTRPSKVAPKAFARATAAFFGRRLEFLLEELGGTMLIIAGIAADNCVLFTASDAYVRKYRLWIPRDCVVSLRDQDRRRSLDHMRRVLKADVRSSRHA